ncbi:MAG TPA: class I SAM-dependent methyltransferase [Myxococcales bacterium]|nr:class I SAM-dependent methyltransferase [Myxococcales bacterium]
MAAYDYEGIPVGFYDQVLRGGNPIRRLWHLSKFERVLDCLPKEGQTSLLDIGCFAGSFLSLVPADRFRRQLGVDILPAQIEYAKAHHGTSFREFRFIDAIERLDTLGERFDCITLIEVLEHLTARQGQEMLRQISRRLAPGGRLVLTTPNYASTWPLLEALLDRFSDVKYEEQHITRFTFFNLERKLGELYPAFAREFQVELKTTSHSVTPFLAGLSFRGARFLSRLVPHRHWRFPFGNLVLFVARRTEAAQHSSAARASAAR